MTVYVDDAEIPYKGMIMSHMIADSHTELLEMAVKIGLKRHWLQCPGTYREHFDISLTMRDRATFHGAEQITYKELGRKVKERGDAQRYEQQSRGT